MGLTIVVDMACTSRICGSLVKELWPREPPRVIALPVSGFSAAHEKYVADYKATHGGAFLGPLLAEHGASDDQVALVGFSAGCWGVRDILTDEMDRVGCVLAVDGVHGTFEDETVKVHPTWLKYASMAASGEKVLAISFSAIVPPGYPSTKSTAHALADRFGIALGPGELAGVECQQIGQSGNLGLVGAWPPGTDGNSAAAHVYQETTVQEALWKAYLAPWSEGRIATVSPSASNRNKWLAGGAAAAAVVAIWATLRRLRRVEKR
jgi:hypothetical protein